MAENNIIPDLSDTHREDVPEEYTWKIDEVYSSREEWKKEKNIIKNKIEELQNSENGWNTSAGTMFDFLKKLSEVEKSLSTLYSFAAFLSDTDMSNSLYQSMRGEIQTMYVNLRSSLSFMEPDILKLKRDRIELYIKTEPGLKEYKMLFDSVLRMKKHILPKEKSKIAALTGLFSDAPRNASSILNDIEIPHPEVELPSGEKTRLNWTNYVSLRSSGDPDIRKKTMETYWENHSLFRNTHAALLDGEVKKNYFNSKIRGYDSSVQAALFPGKIDLEVYMNLIESVKENLAPLHKYIKLKERMLNLKKIHYRDIYASSISSIERRFSYEEAVSLVAGSMSPLGSEYTDILNKGLSERWVDIYPNKGKNSGAYSNGNIYDLHPFVLMNYNGKFSSVSTLAHEMGHALHSWFSNRHQPFPLADYPIFLAEIASTFNENLLISFMMKSDEEDLVKLFILDQYLEGFRGTLYRQTLFAEFELIMHNEVEQGGTLTADWLDENYFELTKKYYGEDSGIMKVDKYIANEWSAIPHFYYNFYVYQYSTGMIASTALAESVISGGDRERKNYLNFLSSGGSNYPLEILKKAGIDLTSKTTTEAAFRKFSSLVSEMEEKFIPFLPSSYPS
ncbi:MAG: oligoendopeptidase F [Acidobacteriota bacterium]